MENVSKLKIIDWSCLFSDCRSYRWSLDLKISLSKKEIIFIGLNPSKTNQFFLDKTTKKIIKICNKYNYGKIKLINLFGLVSTSPKLLKMHNDPIGYLNNIVIENNINYWSKSMNCDLWIGWGNKGTLFDRDIQVYKIIKKYISLKKKKFSIKTEPLLINKTKHNNPMHPLYCPDNARLFKFNF
tara:strand:+ start:244 stop:795 length:552 start_codon:yes stop_codon:yes gene_type:complete